MSDKKYPVKKGTVQETLIIPLFARKLVNERFPTLYTDPAAAPLCEKLDYDFTDLEQKANSIFYEFGALEGAMRQLDMMWKIKDYLKLQSKESTGTLQVLPTNH